jgi:hypothetical protein
MRSGLYALRSCLVVLLLMGSFYIGAQQLIWDEDFHNNASAWFEDPPRMVVSGGRYEFFSAGNDAYSWRTTPLQDGVITVDTSWIGQRDTHGYGILFRLQNASNFYFFWIAAQGYYVVGKAHNGSVYLFQRWTFSDVIIPHGDNTLSVSMSGSTFSLSVNEVPLFTFSDDAYPQGGFGFYTQQSVAAAFDNLRVWEGLPSETTTSVYGTVLDKTLPVAHIPVRAYLISSLDEMQVVLSDETLSDAQGRFVLELPKDHIFVIQAGVSEQQWRSGGGRYGGTVIDLAFPEDPEVIILLEE